MIALKDRILFRDGKSLATDNYILDKISTTGEIPENLLTISSFDADQYAYVYDQTLSIGDNDNDKEYEVVYDNHTQFDKLSEFLYSCRRDKTNDAIHKERLNEELSFFVRHRKQDFLCNIKDFVDMLIKDGAVWGGRGSSCASYTLFLIGVHPINPIKYDIDFAEFSKEVQ